MLMACTCACSQVCALLFTGEIIRIGINIQGENFIFNEVDASQPVSMKALKSAVKHDTAGLRAKFKANPGRNKKYLVRYVFLPVV